MFPRRDFLFKNPTKIQRKEQREREGVTEIARGSKSRRGALILAQVWVQEFLGKKEGLLLEKSGSQSETRSSRDLTKHTDARGKVSALFICVCLVESSALCGLL